MASYTYFSSDAYRRHPTQTLHHKVSDLSESSDSPGPLRARESLLSLPSLGGETSPVSQAPSSEHPWHGDETSSRSSYERSNVRYQPVSTPSSNISRFRSFRARVQDTIHEDESIDMSTLGMAVASSRPNSYTAVPHDDPLEPDFDMTSFSGPIGAQDMQFLRSLREEVDSDKIGEAPRPRDLPETKSRSITQEDTGYKGKASEMIMEESADPYPSPTIGHHSPGESTPKERAFGPKHNWKPISMRWPYLLLLIVLAILFGVAQELAYQMSRRPGGLFHFTGADDFDSKRYAVFKFIPIVITVVYGVLWHLTDTEVRRLEVYYQMSHEGGASAADSISVNYNTPFDFTRLFFISHRGNLAVTVSSIATFLATFIVPIVAAAVLVLTPDRATRQAHLFELKVITEHAVPSRLLTVIFFIIAILGCVLMYRVTTRHSGLTSDTKGISGLASMAVGTKLMMEFQDMDTAKPEDIHRRLQSRRYELRDSSIYSEEFIPSGTYKATQISDNPHPLMLRQEGYIPLLVGLVLFFILLPVFIFSPASAVVYKTPWFITLISICIKLAWRSLDSSIRMLEPYYILANRHASPSTLVLDYTAMPLGVAAIRALLNQHWIVFLVSWGTVLAEALTIFSTSLAQVGGKDFVHLSNNPLTKEPSRSFKTFVAMLVLTAFILAYLCAVTAIVIVYRRRPVLPRQPNTIASVLAYLHQSKMMCDFVGTSKFTTAQMRQRLDGLGSTYGFGWFEGRDSQAHCGVDEEELMTNYKHEAGKGWDEFML